MDTTQQYAQQNFSLPHDVVKLPSGGLFYKSKKKSIKVGYLTAYLQVDYFTNQRKNQLRLVI